VDLEDRKRIRCKQCNLVQFVQQNKQCRRCKQSYAWEPLPTPAVVETELRQSANSSAPAPLKTFAYWLPVVFCYLRTKQGKTQEEIAHNMKAGGPYVSRVEGGLKPNLPTFERYCAALNVSPYIVIRMTELLIFGE